MQTTKPVTHADLAARLTKALADNPDAWIKYDLDTDFYTIHPDSDSLELGQHVLDLSYHADRADNVRTMINGTLDAILSASNNSGLIIFIRHYHRMHNLSMWVLR